MTDVLLPTTGFEPTSIEVVVHQTDDSFYDKFKRLFLDDPIYQAMSRGDVLWGDIIMTEEETAFSRQWAQQNQARASAPTVPEEESERGSPLFFKKDLEADTWQIPTKPHRRAETEIVVPPFTVGIRTIIARNLPRDISIEALRAVFEKYGPIKDVYIPRNMDRSSPMFGTVKGFALIKFLKPTDSAAAYTGQYGRLRLGSNNISIEFAKEDR